jgi:hypothetical protein
MNALFSINNCTNVLTIKFLVYNESSFNVFKIRLFYHKHLNTKHLVKIVIVNPKMNHHTLHSLPNVDSIKEVMEALDQNLSPP